MEEDETRMRARRTRISRSRRTRTRRSSSIVGHNFR